MISMLMEIFVIITLYIAGSFGDLSTTWIALGRGYREGNPFVSLFKLSKRGRIILVSTICKSITFLGLLFMLSLAYFASFIAFLLMDAMMIIITLRNMFELTRRQPI